MSSPGWARANQTGQKKFALIRFRAKLTALWFCVFSCCHCLVLVVSFIPIPRVASPLQSPLTTNIILFAETLDTKTRTPNNRNANNKNKQDDPHPQHPVRVVIVGGGVGGLATAARIATSFSPDCSVTILEKNQFVGGRSGSFDVAIPNVGTFRHERGPSLLLLPHVYRELFQECGSWQPQDFGLEIRPCIPAYQVVFDDGDRLDVGFPISHAVIDKHDGSDVFSTKQQKSRNKMDHYETNGAKKWDDYMRAMSAYLDCGLPNFIEESLDLLSFPAFLREALRDFGKAWPLKPHSDVLDAMFESDKMKALASFQDLYVGLEPYRNNAQPFGGVLQSTAPAVFGLLAAIELHPDNQKAGVFAPVGGFRAVSESFEKLAKASGVGIETGKAVTKIDPNGVYICDTTDTESEGKFVPADMIIVNADLPYASKSLLQSPPQSRSSSSSSSQAEHAAEYRFDWDDSMLFSSGVVAFHWSLGIVLEDLNTHNVFLAASRGRVQAKESWRLLRATSTTNSKERKQEENSVEPFNFYVHCPARTDSTACPEGCDSMMVLVPCRTLQRQIRLSSLQRDDAIRKYKEQFDDEYIAKLRQAVLDRFASIESLRDLNEHILHEVVDSPATYADQYHVGAGTPFAISHGFGQLSLTRPSATYGMSSDSNILYCGASSRPGNGVPLVLIGSKLVAKKALSKLRDMVRAKK